MARLLGAAGATTASRSSTAGRRRTTSASRGGRRAEAARRELRHQPAGRGPVRRPAGHRGADRRWSSRRASARSSSPASCAAPTRRTRPSSSSTSSSPSASRPSSRSTCSCTRPTATSPLPPEFTEYAVRPRRPGDARPGHDRRQPGVLDRPVDRPRPALTPRIWAGFVPDRDLGGIRPSCRDGSRPELVATVAAGRSRRRAGRVPRRVLRLAGSSPCWRVADGAAVAGASTWEIAWFTLWQAVASTVAHRRRRAAARLRDGPLPLPGPAPPLRAAHRGVRAADRRDGRGDARPAPGADRARRLGDPRRPRHVQPRRRRAHRRRGVGAPPRRPGGGGRDARRVAVAGGARDHPARCCARRSSPRRRSCSSSRSPRSA